jgi:hypothetical protein
MKKVSLFFSVLAFVSFVAITPVSAATQDNKPKTAQKVEKKACSADAKKACCADSKKAGDSKACTKAKAKAAAPAPKK